MNRPRKELLLPPLKIFQQTHLKIRDLLGLEKGDVVSLDQRKDEEISVSLSGKPMFLGRPGTHRRHRAFKVTRVLGGETEWLA